MGAKRMFTGTSFVFQKCETADVARKVLEAKGVAHFMDQVLIPWPVAGGRNSILSLVAAVLIFVLAILVWMNHRRHEVIPRQKYLRVG